MKDKRKPPSKNPHSETATSISSRQQLIVIALVLVLFVVQVAILYPFGIDDVGISYRYALHLAEGEGLTWNPGGEPVEGYSNLLWVLILAGGKMLGTDIEPLSKMLGVVLGALNLIMIVMLCRRLWPQSRWWWVPAGFVVLSPEWIAWTVSGLEIAIFGTFLLVGLLGASLQGSRRLWLLSVSVAGLALTRPEGAVLGFVLLAVAYWLERRHVKTVRMSDYLLPLIVLAVVSIGLIVFRLSYYGYPFPNTVVAKFDPAMPSAKQIGWWLVYTLPLIASIVIIWQTRTSPKQPFVLWTGVALAIVQILIVLPVVPVMHFLHRYQIAFLPLLAVAAPAGIEFVRRRYSGVAPLTLGILALWSMQGWPAVWSRMQGDVYMREQQMCIVERLNALKGNPTVALQDAGRIPFETDLPALDAWGLCDIEIAREGFTPETILRRRPAVYVMSASDWDEKGFSPKIGMDDILINQPAFKNHYSLWTVCRGDGPPADWAYDYAIFIDHAWGLEHGFRE
ncbi:MAG: hypothetical protein GF341_06715 [candidate division Zixibacteria bacterium]|nr:hypothetical protein [candidate division Zixibacteria bacterium]